MLFVSHGAAAFTLHMLSPTERWLRQLSEGFAASPPKAVLVVSPHLERPEFTLGGAEKPRTVHDHPFSGMYRLRYPAPGAPQIAERARALLEAAGLSAQVDPKVGLDHGTWLPLVPLFPNADVPIVPMGIRADLDIQAHIRAGEALRPLLDDGVLLLASGNLSHNLRTFRNGWMCREDTEWALDWSRGFEAWVAKQLTTLPPEQWASALAGYRSHKYAAKAHPRGDHMLPLLLAIGAAAVPGARAVFQPLSYQHGMAMGAFTFHRPGA